MLKTRRIYGDLYSSDYQDKRKELESQFHDLAFRAYFIDPNNPEAVSMYSRSFNIKKDYAQRLKYAKQALDLNPSHAGSNHDYGLALLNEKRFEEAEAHIEKAMKMNPIGRRSYEGLLPLVYMAMANSDKSLEWSNIMYYRGGHSRYHGFRAAIFFYHVAERHNSTKAARLAGYAYPKQAAYQLTRHPAILPLMREARQTLYHGE